MPYSLGGGGGKAPTGSDNENYALSQPYELSWPITADQISNLNEMLIHLFKSDTKAAASIAGIPTSSGVTGPTSSTDGDIATFDGTDGQTIQDSGILASTVVIGPASVVSGNVATFGDTSGKLLSDSGFTLGTGVILAERTSISTSDMDAINTSPKLVVSNPGSGVYVAPLLFSLDANKIDPYDSNVNLNFFWNNGDTTALNANVLNANLTILDRRFLIQPVAGLVTTTNPTNTGIILKGSANPTVGASHSFSGICTVAYYLVDTN